jgi:hypothetical protein
MYVSFQPMETQKAIVKSYSCAFALARSTHVHAQGVKPRETGLPWRPRCTGKGVKPGRLCARGYQDLVPHRAHAQGRETGLSMKA